VVVSVLTVEDGGDLLRAHAVPVVMHVDFGRLADRLPLIVLDGLPAWRGGQWRRGEPAREAAPGTDRGERHHADEGQAAEDGGHDDERVNG